MRQFRIMMVLTALTLSIAQPLQADPKACLNTPTQACVIDMAIAVAEEKSNLNVLASGFLAVAIGQERARSGQHPDTIEHLLTLLDVREPDPLEVVYVLSRRTIAFRNQLGAAPEVSGQIASAVMEMRPELDDDDRQYATIAAAKFFGFAGDLEQVIALIDTAPEDQQFTVGLEAAIALLRRGDLDGARLVAEIIAEAEFSHRLNQVYVSMLVDLGEFDRAQEAAGLLENEADRMNYLGFIAAVLAKRGQFEEALDIAIRIEQLAQTEMSGQTASYLAEVYAWIGDEHRVDTLLRISESDSAFYTSPKHADRERARAALVAGNPEMVLTQLAAADSELKFSVLLHSAASAHFYSGRPDLSVFFENLPAQYLHVGLNTLGSVQATTGDLDGARETFDRLAREHPDAELVFDGIDALIRGLILHGSLNEALDLAIQQDNALLLAEIAFELE